MRFTVPQFIEHEAKIVGPLTFRQFVYVGLAGAICFVLYFSVPFSIFLVSCIVFGAGGLAFAFLKIGGRTMPTIVANFLRYSLAPKMYIWHKKEQAVAQVYKKEVKKKTEEEGEDELPLKIAEKSQLKKLHTKIETKTK